MARHIYPLLLSIFLIFSFVSNGYSEPEKRNTTFQHSGLDYESRIFSDNLKAIKLKAGTSRSKLLKRVSDSTKKEYHLDTIEALKQLLVLDAGKSGTWLRLSKTYFKAIPAKGSRRYDLQQKASVTAYQAFKLAKNDADKAAALAHLGKALEKRSYWRPALNALKTSLYLNEDREVREQYKALRATRGFRITNYQVDSEAENPRLCVQFSERLQYGDVDFAKFITVNGKAPAGAVAENRQLCVEGLVHGKRFIVRVREGLPSTVNETLLKSSDLTVYVRDRKPAVRFTAKGYVLPKTGQNGIPLITINADKVAVEIYRVGDRALNRTVLQNYMTRNYDRYSINQLKRDLGQKVWSGEMAIKSSLNKDVTTAIPVTKAIKDIKPGLYVVYAWTTNTEQERSRVRAAQWFVVSDIGLATLSGDGGLHTFVRSLTTAAPIEGATVRLIARNNEILGTAKTDANGHVKFAKGLINGEGSQAPHLVVAERDAGDYAFLDVTTSSFDLTDRGVSGRSTPGPLDAFIYTERGVYRTGEEVYLTTLLRDKAGRAVPKVPLTLVVNRADGVEFKRIVLQDEGNGGRSHILSLPDNAGSGRWSASVYADPKGKAIGNVSFLVEDYTPQRMELELTSESKVVDQETPVSISATGRYLYGAPTSNMFLNGEILVRENTSGLKNYKGYSFGVYDEKFLNINKEITGLPKTDAKGIAELKTRLPKIPDTNKPLEAQFTIRLLEDGGRSLTKQISFNVKPNKTLIGIRPLFGSSHVGEDQTAEFDIIAVAPDGSQAEAKGLKWELLKIERRYQWYTGNNGYWNYKTITYTRKIANGEINATADAAARISKKLDWGSYRLDISSPEDGGAQSSYRFNSGWYSSDNTDRPDKLEIALDKKSYKAGDKLTVNLSPKHDGKALVAVIEDHVLAMKTVDVSKSGTKVDFEVGKDWGAGAYVTAMFYRPLDEKARRMPTRSIGMAWLKPDLEQKKLKISMNVPEKIRPNSQFDIPVKLDGMKAGDEAKIVIAAVDVGILNLTRYKSPNPNKWYFGQRLLGTEFRDLYGKLINGMEAASGQIRSGGGAGNGAFGAPPAKSVEPVALYSGIVLVNKDGTANVKFDMPAFDGTVRLMAVAWNANQLGSAEKDVIVRDPVVVIGTAPRFLTYGDKSSLQFSLDNVEGPAGEYSYKVTGTKTVGIEGGEAKVAIAAKERKQFSVPVSAAGYGAAKLTLNISGPDNFALSRDFNFNINPAAPDIKRRLISKLPKNGGKLSVTKDVTEGLIPETVKVSVNVDKNLALDVPGLLLALDRYPYGCAEQTTSRALPLLYLSKVADTAGVTGIKDAKKRIDKAIIRLAGMQASNGSFGLWSPYSGGNTWLTAYITDFLTRAKEQGYKLPSGVFERALDNLQNSVNYASDFKSGGEGLSYSLYVLARNGRANIGDLRYFADAKLDNFSTSLAKAQLGASLAMYGDKDRANQAYRAALSAVAHGLKDKNYRVDYGSALRDGAAAITLISESRVTGTSVTSFSKLLEKVRSTQKYTSTQENAWMLLAAHALQQEAKDLKLGVNGVPHDGSLKKVLSSEELAKGEYLVTNRGDEEIQAALTVTGHGAYPEPAASEGFAIIREIYTLDGKAVKLDKVKQNDRFVVVLKVTELTARKGRLIMVDRIPAGFEIENPTLVAGSDVKKLPWLKRANQLEHSQFKDDKFYAAFNMTRSYKKDKPSTMMTAYIVRAVSPGTYLHPAATIEDMYRLDRYARTEAGKVTIERK